jgi:hypothetical protein
MRRKKPLPVDLSDISFNMPLGIEEIESYVRLDLSNHFLGDENLEQFMHRTLLTVRQVKDLRVNFDNELRKKTLLHSQKSGASIDPLVAAKFLTPEQQVSLLDSLSRDRIAYLDRKIKNVDKSIQDVTLLMEKIGNIMQLPNELINELNALRSAHEKQ